MNTQYSVATRIRKEAERFNRITMIFLIMVFSLYVFYNTIYQQWIQVNQTRDKVVGKLLSMNSSINGFIEDVQLKMMAQSLDTSAFYNTLYQFKNSDQIEVELSIIVEGRLYLTSSPLMHGDAYSQAFNTIIMQKAAANTQTVYATRRIEQNARVQNMIVLAKALPGQSNSLIMVFISPEYLQSLLSSRNIDQMVITDRFDYILATTSTTVVGAMNRFNEDDNRRIVVNATSFDVRETAIPTMNLSVKSLVIAKPFWTQYGLYGFSLIVMLIILQISSRMISKRFAKDTVANIQQLTRAVEEIQSGHLDYQVSIHSKDEFEVLAHQFNTMVHQLNQLMTNNERLIELRKDAQRKQLEAQFNPHFLYNSLETIRYLIVLDPEKATELILELTKLLRYSINDQKTEVDALNDLVFVRKYLDITQLRLQERFDYSIEYLEADLSGVKIPRLLIQPIIENAIKYGYHDRDFLRVRIVFKRIEQQLLIDVENTGSPIPERQIAAIKASFTSTYPQHSYGLYSIHQRLKLIYGGRSKMTILSNDTVTRISIVIDLEHHHA